MPSLGLLRSFRVPCRPDFLVFRAGLLAQGRETRYAGRYEQHARHL